MWKNDPVTLTFLSQNYIISRIFQGHSLNQVWKLWDLSFLSYDPDKKQTNKQMDPNILTMPTDSVGMDN